MFVADGYFPIEQEGEIRGLESGVRRRVRALQFGIYGGYHDVRVLDANPDFADSSRIEVATINAGGPNNYQVTLSRRVDVPFWSEPIVRVAR